MEKIKQKLTSRKLWAAILAGAVDAARLLADALGSTVTSPAGGEGQGENQKTE